MSSGLTMATVSDNRSAAPAGSLADCAWERNTSFDLAPSGLATRSSIGRVRPRSRGSEDAQRSASALVRAWEGISLRTSAVTRAFGKSTSRMASRAEVCEMKLIMVGRMVDARAGSVSSRIFPLSCGWLPGIERVALQWVTNSRYSDLGCDVSSFRGRHNAGESPIEHPQSSPFAAELRRSSGSLEPGWAAMLPLARICRFIVRVYRQLAGKWGDRTFTWRLKARGRPVFVRRRSPVRAKLSGSSLAFPCCAQKPRLQAPWRAETSTFSPVLPHPAQKPRLPALRRLATRRISDAQLENGSVRAKYATPSPSAELEAGNSARRTFQRFRFRRASASRVGVG